MLAMLARASDNPFRQSLGLPWERKPRERTDVITSVRCTFLHFEALIAERLIARPTDTGRRWRGQFPKAGRKFPNGFSGGGQTAQLVLAFSAELGRLGSR